MGKGDEKEVLMTEGQLDAIVGKAVGKVLEGVLPAIISALKGSSSSSELAPRPEDEAQASMIRKLQGLDRALPPTRRERRKGRETGATFVALIVPNSVFPKGRVERIDDYTHPEGVDRHVQEGGLVPDGMSIRHPNTGTLQPKYKQWLYEAFLLGDLRRFVRDDRNMSGKGVENLELFSELIEVLGEEPARMPDPRRGAD